MAVGFNNGCGVKVDQLPYLENPYVSEIQFLKKIENVEDKVKKTHFSNNRIRAPFYLYLKLNAAENYNHLSIKFYNQLDRKIHQITFEFGEDGKFYEYILFTDKISKLKGGRYRYIIFINNHAIYENRFRVEPSEKERRRILWFFDFFFHFD